MHLLPGFGRKKGRFIPNESLHAIIYSWARLRKRKECRRFAIRNITVPALEVFSLDCLHRFDLITEGKCKVS